MVHAYNPGAQEAEKGERGVWEQPGLHSDTCEMSALEADRLEAYGNFSLQLFCKSKIIVK
jgi:hypothetical protein